MRPIRQSRGQRGVTLVEILVVLAITTVVMLAVYEMMDDAVRTSLFVEAHNDLPVFGQDAANRIQREIMQSRAFYSEDTVGLAYRDGLVVSGSPVKDSAAPNTLLPVAEVTTSTILPDVAGGTRYVGNSLLIARQLSPLIGVTFDHDANTGTSEVEFPADRYEFQYYYPKRETRRSFSGMGYYLDLVQATSQVYADYFQLTSLTAAQRVSVHPKLIAAGLTIAWDPAAPRSTAFWRINSNGTFTQQNNPTIPVIKQRSLFPQFVGGRISGFMSYSLGMRRTATTQFPLRDPIPKFAAVNSATPAYPGGFEVKIVGPAGRRKVFTRFVLMTHYSVTRYDSAETTALTSARF